MNPTDLLRHHVTGAIERGEKQPVVEKRAKRVTPRQVYLLAAKDVHAGNEFACCAISESVDVYAVKDCPDLMALRREFGLLFKPEEQEIGLPRMFGVGSAWGQYWGEGDNLHKSPEARECRVLALCFMAAMVT